MKCESQGDGVVRQRHPLSIKSAVCALTALAPLFLSSAANAAAELKLGDNAGVTAGFGLRASYSARERAAPDGTSRSNDFTVENARLYFGAHYGDMLKATLNTEKQGGSGVSGGDNLRILDAIVQFEPTAEFNVWLGRMLPPSDRPNLYGPFFALPWSYPGVASNYPAVFAGRDNGATVWGKPFGGKLVYSVGVFEGHNRSAAASNKSDKILIAARVQYAFLDPEPAPAYYLGGTYGGTKDILTLGASGYHQSNGVGSAARPGTLKIWSTDLLFEKKFSIGVPTIEAGYYRYDLGAVDCGSGEPGAPACPASGGDNIGGQVDGKAYLVGGAWLIPGMVGWGQFQPFVRWQKFDRKLSNTDNKAFDVGVNYLIKGPNAKLALMYSKLEDTRLPVAIRKTDQYLLGVQLQY
jgi:hypothetical protein